MVKETTELVTARALLKKVEGNLGDPGMLVDLRNAINSLWGKKLKILPSNRKRSRQEAGADLQEQSAFRSEGHPW